MAIKVIGITGQVGSGKSAVANIMKDRFDAYLILTDIIAHNLMKKGAICYQLIINYFGNEILDETREINRSKLSNIVFRDANKLSDLNDMVHPYVMNIVFDDIRRLKKENSLKYVIIETAILIESGYKEICDEIWYVTISNETRRERLRKSRGYSDEKIDNILKNQLNDKALRENSTRIIDNNGKTDDLRKQIELLLVN